MLWNVGALISLQIFHNIPLNLVNRATKSHNILWHFVAFHNSGIYILLYFVSDFVAFSELRIYILLHVGKQADPLWLHTNTKKGMSEINDDEMIRYII